MNFRHRDRPTMVMLAAFAVSITVGLAACGSSDASTTPTSPVTVAAVTSVKPVPATTSRAATLPVAVDAEAPTTDATAPVSDAEVADMEKQLDEIDQLLVGVDSDLGQD